MAILNQKKILNLIPKVSAPVTIHVSQGDVGTEIEFTLVKGDEVFSDTGNLSASVHGVREDGANFGPFTCTLSGSKVTFSLRSEMTAVKGSALAEVVLVDNGGNKVGSANFGILVEESVFPLGVTYDNDVSVYESILAYAQSSAAQLVDDYTSKINAVQSNLSSEVNERTNADVLINTRIDEIIAPSGEAPNPAEITDARIGADNVTYSSLGEANRTQFDNTLHYKRAATTNYPCDSLFDTGIYAVVGSNKPSDWPFSGNGQLWVFRARKISSTDVTTTIQVAIAVAGGAVFRGYSAGAWQAWHSLTEDVNAYKYIRKLTTSDNMDDITTMGSYRIVSDYPINYPISSNGHLLVFKNDKSGSTIISLTMQILISSSLQIMYRTYTSDAWTDWVTLENSIDEYGTFGIQINKSTGKESRISQASLLNYAQYEDNTLKKSDFDNVYPWCDIRECNIEFLNGTPIITYSNESGFSRTKDTFIEIPKFYFKRTKIGNTEKWLISGIKGAGFVCEPWFIDSNGNEVDKRYLAKYPIPDFTLDKISITGAIPQRSKTKSQFKTYIQNKGFKLASLKAYLALTHLMIVEYGTFNSQNINAGISWYTYSTANYAKAINTALSNTIRLPYSEKNTYIDIGDTFYVANSSQDISDPRIVTNTNTDNETYVDITFSGESFNIIAGTTYGYASAQPSGKTDYINYVNGRADGSPLTRAFKYREIENLYGNIGELMDNCFYRPTNHKIYIDNEALSFTTPYNDSYIDAQGAGDGFITDLGYDNNKQPFTLPAQIGGSYDVPFFDEWSSFNDDSDGTLSYGCGWDHWVGNGALCFRSITSHGWLYGARAEY